MQDAFERVPRGKLGAAYDAAVSLVLTSSSLSSSSSAPVDSTSSSEPVVVVQTDTGKRRRVEEACAECSMARPVGKPVVAALVPHRKRAIRQRSSAIVPRIELGGIRGVVGKPDGGDPGAIQESGLGGVHVRLMRA